MVGIQDIELKQTRFYQDVYGEGRQEGRRQEAQALLLRLLGKRFGPLGEEVQLRIAEAGIEQLEAWTDNLLDAPDIVAVFDTN
ncbi:protein of unknown function [Methylomagnum ishizawai]|uniref:DUF4351 domain-containing protein n=1 Tax=Methylomagnum ishizawai TaxID=1760988 RepID=A0A1Y6CVI9_9GAMM|nr:DUF4351 domain-containing protein [Methylomagnum ishizawai]SMF94306.1 protein of unknown function [Methylomagnum ishizawai]